MIQQQIRNDRGELETLHEGDLRYWEGPYRHEPFPMTLFKASIDGQMEQRVIRHESEREALGAAWCDTPDAAREYIRKLEAEMAAADAEHNYQVSKMSEKAQAEALAYARSTDNFVADVPAPRRKPGPKPKAQQETPA